MLVSCFGLNRDWDIVPVYIGQTPREREKEKRFCRREKKQPNTAHPHLLQAQYVGSSGTESYQTDHPGERQSTCILQHYRRHKVLVSASRKTLKSGTPRFITVVEKFGVTMQNVLKKQNVDPDRAVSGSALCVQTYLSNIQIQLWNDYTTVAFSKIFKVPWASTILTERLLIKKTKKNRKTEFKI